MVTRRICITRKKEKKQTNKPNRISKLTLVLSVSKQHEIITMYITFLYVNGIPFFLSKTGKLNFLSDTKLKLRSDREITNAINQDQNKHEQRGF